ncbi:MAG: FAD-dependent oxidoreductase [Slackia piriformis]|uniref:FAD-dependent oxidoreductase n=1 Tax=Slackia piriformis TaxID=626934 RepID=A0A943UXC1_9ACTN|nr:FAD-dependent oxidoreductase [Slackia piriformis]
MGNSVRNGVSRRSFVKSLGLGAAGLGAFALAGCAADGAKGSSSASDKWDHEADVVVVGTGTAGVAAAKTALDAGATVIMVEKEAGAGGVSSVCEQYCAFDSDLHIPQNFDDVQDSAELMLQDAMLCSNGTADEKLAKVYCDKSAEGINWMIEQGCEFKDTLRVSDGRAGQGKYILATPGDLTMKVLASIEAQGGEILTKTPLSSIVRDGETGRVIGIRCDEDKIGIKANKGVVICTGPWGNDEVLTARHTKVLPDIVTECADTLASFGMPYGPYTGEAIIAAQKAGAAVRHMEYMMYDPYYSVPEVMSQKILPAGLTRAVNQVLVTSEGKRFTNEGADRGAIALDIIDALPDHVCYPIVDGRHMPDPTGSIKVDAEKVAKLSEAGILASGDTIEALAADMEAKFGTPASAVLETIARYNDYCASGVDAEFGKDPHHMTPIDQAPFVAGPAETAIPMSTHGGIEINEEARVIDVEGNPIPGLFAAGMCTGGVLGTSTTSGNWQMSGLVYGRIAGELAAAETV